MLENNNGLETITEEITKPKKNKKFTIILGIVGFIIILLVGFLVYYLINLNNPKNVYKQISNYLFSNLENVYKEIDLSNTGYINGNLKINTNISEYSFLDNEQFNYALGYDINNMNAKLELGLVEDAKEIIGLNANIQNNNIYVYLKELFSKTILIDNSTFKEETGLSIEEFFQEIENYFQSYEDGEYIVKQIHSITNKALNEANYVKVKETININNKNISTTKMILNLNKSNLQTLVNVFIEEILNNNELVEKLAKVYSMTNDELKESLNTFKETTNEMEELEEKVQISIYTSGIFKKVIKVSLESEEECYSYTTYDNYKSIELGDMLIEIKNNNLEVISENEVLITGSVNSLELDNIDITFKSNDKEINFDGSIKYTNNEDNTTTNILINIDTMNISIIMNNKKVDNKNLTNTSKVIVNMDNQKIEISNTANITTEYLNDETINDTLNINNMTEEDMMTIQNNLLNKLSSSKLFSSFASVLFQIQTSTKKTFLNNVNSIYTGAVQAMLLDNSTCYTVNDLIAKGYIDSSLNSIQGTISSTINGYRIELFDTNYLVRKNAPITDEDIHEYDISIPIKTTCNY